MRRYILILGVLLVAWGCDDFLTVRPKSDIIEGELFQTSEGVEDALYGVYAKMAHEQLYGKNLTCYVPDILAQMYKTGKGNETIKQIGLVHHDNASVRIVYNTIWKEAYEAIGFANNVINSLKQQDETSMKYYSTYYGEALGLRAFLHFDLVRLFASHIGTRPDDRGIPYVRQWTPLVTPFSTVKEVYAAILDDLKKSEAFLKKGQENMDKGNDFTNNRQTHFNLYAAQALLARVYWMKGDLDSAGIYARKVINSEQFNLSNPGEISEMVSQVISVKEGIWGLYTNQLTKMYGNLFYDSESIIGEGDASLNPRDDYKELYVNVGRDNDMRLPGWFRQKLSGGVGDEEEGEGSRLRFIKLFREKNMVESTPTYPKGVKPGINLLRLSEMYLIVAEALLEKEPDVARDYFDTFIVSRGLISFKDKGLALTMEDINKERRKELLGEGQEFFNMKRQMRDIEVVSNGDVLEGSDEIYKLIIPDSEFEFRYDDE